MRPRSCHRKKPCVMEIPGGMLGARSCPVSWRLGRAKGPTPACDFGATNPFGPSSTRPGQKQAT
eukprot:6012336-Alexandrium_andersonii.AAC.1